MSNKQNLHLTFFYGNKPPPHRRCFHAFGQVDGQVIAPAGGVGDVGAQVFGVDDAAVEQIQVRVLIELVERVHLVPIFAEFGNQLAIGLGEGLGMPDALDRVHGMILADGIDAQPFDLLRHTPVRKIGRGAGMADHITEFVGVGAVPAVFIEPGLDQQDIAFADLHDAFEHFRRVRVQVGDQMRDVGDGAGADPVLQWHLPDGAAS